MERSTPPRRRLNPLYTLIGTRLFRVLARFYPPIWYNGCMNKDKLDRLNRLVIGKMKNYRLSNDYKEFIEKVGNQYNDDYIERMDPGNKIKPITVVDSSYPIRHMYLDGTDFK